MTEDCRRCASGLIEWLEKRSEKLANIIAKLSEEEEDNVSIERAPK